MKVYLSKTKGWAEVLAQNEIFLVAKSSEGVLTYILKDHMCHTVE